MSIEAQIYTRLSDNEDVAALVGSNIFPTQPTENTASLPHLIYTITGSETNLFMSGSSSLTKYALSIEVYGIHKADVLLLLDAVRSALNDWSGGNVQWSKMDTQSTTSTDPGAMGQQSYTVWATAA